MRSRKTGQEKLRAAATAFTEWRDHAQRPDHEYYPGTKNISSMKLNSIDIHSQIRFHTPNHLITIEAMNATQIAGFFDRPHTNG
jgi:hypothetical protein